MAESTAHDPDPTLSTAASTGNLVTVRAGDWLGIGSSSCFHIAAVTRSCFTVAQFEFLLLRVTVTFLSERNGGRVVALTVVLRQKD